MNPAGGRTTPYLDADFIDAFHNGRVFVAKREHQILGAVVLYGPGTPGRDISEPHEAKLTRLAVAFQIRRMGIGRALATRCEDHARSAGCAAILLWSRPAQVEAHRLYESLGYRRGPERDSVDEAGAKRWVFRLPLAPPGN